MTSYYITGDERGKKKRPKYEWSAVKLLKYIISYKDRSFVVAENNRVVKLKCQLFTSLNKMLSNVAIVLIVHTSLLL